MTDHQHILIRSSVWPTMLFVGIGTPRGGRREARQR
jgi:hypothetical protein